MENPAFNQKQFEAVEEKKNLRSYPEDVLLWETSFNSQPIIGRVPKKIMLKKKKKKRGEQKQNARMDGKKNYCDAGGIC